MIFCKAPVAGWVKTRLMTALTAEQSMRVHIELAQRTLQLAADSRLFPIQLWCAPTTDHAFFTEAAQSYPVTLMQQQGDDLGERMHNAFCRAFDNYSRALIIGCDCPSLTAQDLEAAITALNPIAAIEHSKIPFALPLRLCSGLKALSKGGRDFGMLNKWADTQCVLAPAEDGGYVLIGLNQPQPELFDNMPWGTAQVLEQTRARIKRHSLRHHELKLQWDVDTPADLARYRADLGSSQK